MSDDGWDVFGDDEKSTTTAVATPVLPVKRSRANPLAAIAPFLNDDRAQLMDVPPPPVPPHRPTAEDGERALAVWPDHPPLLIGPIALHDFADCGRGFVATRDVAVGEVLMVEAPIVNWLDEERSPPALLRALLAADVDAGQSDQLREKLRALRRLHPMTLTGVPHLAARATEYRSAIEAALPLWRAAGLCDDNGGNGTNHLDVPQSANARSSSRTDGAAGGDDENARNGAVARSDDVEAAEGSAHAREQLLRLCLVARWNAFDSGLFLHQSIFNHAPSRIANCDKASTTAPAGGMLGSNAGGVGDAGASRGGVLSVVRATRPIAAGAQCLITYVQPPELSAAASVPLMAHWDFDSDALPRHPEWDRAPRAPPAPTLASSATPASAADAAAAAADGGARGSSGAGAADVAATDAEMLRVEETALRHVRTALRARKLGELVHDATAALSTAAEALGEAHLGVARARRVLRDGLRKRVESDAADDEEAAVGALLLLLTTAHALWVTQRALLGPLHPDGAQSLHDIGSALGALLARSPRRLFAACPGLWDSPEAVSRGERAALELHAKLAALYDKAVWQGALAETGS